MRERERKRKEMKVHHLTSQHKGYCDGALGFPFGSMVGQENKLDTNQLAKVAWLLQVFTWLVFLRIIFKLPCSFLPWCGASLGLDKSSWLPHLLVQGGMSICYRVSLFTCENTTKSNRDERKIERERELVFFFISSCTCTCLSCFQLCGV